MRLAWVRQQLLRSGAVAAAGSSATHTTSRRRTAPSTSGKSSAYIIADAMEPSGCSCVLVTSRNSRGQQTPSSSSSHVRHRMTLPGITPGTVLRTRQSVVAWIRATRQLPSPDQYTVLMRDGRRISSSMSTTEALPSLPCRRASAQTCTRCPWMALQVRQQSSAAKQKAWRASLLDEVRNCCSAALFAAKEVSTTHKGRGETSDAASSAAPSPSPAQVARCISFAEPLTVPVLFNQLQALQLTFRTRWQQPNPRGSMDAVAATFLDTPAHCTHGEETAGCPEVELVREGSAESNTSRVNDAARCAFDAASAHRGSGGDTGGHCLLETLEQQRLVPFLERWAAQLPSSMQTRLRSICISQPTSNDSSSSRSKASRASLQVAVVVERDTDVLGMQNPLCGPAHPADMLSMEEQQLVAVVTAAAPLLTGIEVLLCICSGGEEGEAAKQGGAAASDDVVVDVLYPQLHRHLPAEYLQLHTNRGILEGAGRKKQLASPSQLVRCWCEPLGRELSARLPPYHAALSALPFSWLTVSSTESHAVRGRAAAGETPSLLTVPTFWRHPEALDLSCSALLSVLLEAEEERSVASDGDATREKAAVTACQIASSAPLFLSIATSASAVPSEAAKEEVGAFAGQRVLDAALRLLLAEASKNASCRSVEVCSAPPASCQEGPSPRQLLVSVDVSTTIAVVLAKVEEALRALPSSHGVRVLLYTCTSRMTTDCLGALTATVMQKSLATGNTTHVRAGVIDVDPLSSSYVAYAQIDVTPRNDTHASESLVEKE